MLIGRRLKELRGSKNLSQGQIEKRTGLLRCYTSRVENCHTVPSLETLEKYAAALEIPLYRIFYDGEHPPTRALVDPLTSFTEAEWRLLRPFRKAFARMSKRDQSLIIQLASKMASRR